MTTRLIVVNAIVNILSLISVGVALFWSAGRLDWWAAWATLGVMAAWLAAMDIMLIRVNPDLFVERLKPPRDAKPWDRSIMSTVRLLQLVRYIVAGLDQHYGWTVGFPVMLQLTGLIMSVLGYAFFTWATYSNAYFSQVVRIQTERGHTVATDGPYRFIRHPGYISAMVSELALSALLGSWVSLIVAAVCVVLFVVRTILEDRTLQTDLPGYREYAERVRYHLIPGVW